MMKLTNYILLSVLLALTMPAFAQDQKTLEYLRQEEQRKKSELLRELDSGVYYMDAGEYLIAESKFTHVLNNIKSVPSDLTFLFGKNSYYLLKYKQSVDWLNKYIQLKGPAGQFYTEATDLLEKAQSELLKENSKDVQKAEEILSKNYDIDCGPTGKVSCPVCKGDHVIIKKGAFGDEYKTCPYCNEHGMLTCGEYNQLLRGELQKKGK
jgi:hypothetical protein